MDQPDDLTVLRARDFWSSLVLIALSIFFFWETTSIPLFGENRAGVSGADWYNSAALVPFGLFGGMFVLAIVLLVISIRSGGAQHALSSVGIGWNKDEVLRFSTIGLTLAAYIVGLVPRVDFILCSGLMITAMIYGYRGGHAPRMVLSAMVVTVAGLYAFVANMPQADWKLHDDDWVTLVLWIGLTAFILIKHRSDRVIRIIPIIAVFAPTILVCAMAFGFRQNVPNRGGLIFKNIEYHYYVSLKPLWSQK
ncbi:tripartite tricarboxylate transporter TctB family protein [Cognatishimia activa]|uniref:tripartite tricarboxylate transporter TctB family protein n=1 Tax=Cognatishimia activa TaxID=1715691 RepID=UPI00222FECEE|nr:tripartite tricarboxylate transporter TctB family protein [Cognatishimia activa]UZD90437.1 hypothetical protein M0D42_12685 [Cognatishimia activa]